MLKLRRGQAATEVVRRLLRLWPEGGASVLKTEVSTR